MSGFSRAGPLSQGGRGPGPSSPVVLAWLRSHAASDLADTGRVLHDALPSAPTPAPPTAAQLGAGLLRCLCQGGGMGWGTQGSVDVAQC
ncbi:unnamed protein product [Gadus morhua 'NCC']